MRERGMAPTLPGILLGVAALLMGSAPASPQFSQSRAATRSFEGKEHYAAGRYREALQAYRDATVEEPDRLDVQFNIGNALYELGDYAGSMAAFGRVQHSDDEDLVTWSWYNAGNAHFQQREYDAAARAYTQALRRDPTAADARANLELALNRLRQQRQEEQHGEEEADPQSDGDADETPDEAGGAPRPEAGDDPEAGDEAAPRPVGERVPKAPERMNRDEALQLLDALEDRDREAQRLRFGVAGHPSQAEDW